MIREKTFITIWIVWAIICLCGAVGIVYVAAHFLSKFW